MLTFEVQLCLGQMPSVDDSEVVGAQARKLFQQLAQRFALTLPKLGEPIERGKAPILALSEDDARARNPVGALAVNEMADDDIWTPRLRSFGRIDPRGWQTVEHRTQRGRRAFEHRDCIGEIELHFHARLSRHRWISDYSEGYMV